MCDKEGYLSTRQKKELVDKLNNTDLASEDAMEKFEELKEIIYGAERDNESVEEMALGIIQRTKLHFWLYDCEGIYFWSSDEQFTFSHTLLYDLHEAFNH